MNTSELQKIELHDAFWRRAPLTRPLLSFQVGGDRFPYDKMRAARALMRHGLTITPDMVDVGSFAEQTEEEIAHYERNKRNLPGDMLRGVAPFGGIPWMECLLGCGVMAMEHSFVSVPCQKSPGEPGKLRLENSPWLKKYVEFLETYERRFSGRYPVTETLMRGCLDVYGAIIGQENMVYAFYDAPDIAYAMLSRINELYVEMVKLTLKHSRPIAGGILHPYGLWTPGTVNQFQEDMCALVTPEQMAKFVVPIHNRMCAQFDINGMHTHPTSYHVMPQQLSVNRLNLVQAQKDEGDPLIFDRIGVLQSIQRAGKCLHFGSDLSIDEIDALLDALDMRGLSLTVRVRNEDDAMALYEHICAVCAKNDRRSDKKWA